MKYFELREDALDIVSIHIVSAIMFTQYKPRWLPFLHVFTGALHFCGYLD